MSYPLDLEIKLFEIKCSYIINSQHRKKAAKTKSKWLISKDKEVRLFVRSHKSFRVEYICWGILNDENSKIIIIGINRFSEDLFFAKFIDSNKNKKWHGYPADFKRNIQDRPPVNILKVWEKKGKITKHQISKISSGKKCNL